MVKLFTRILAYSWRYYAVSVLVFVAFWQAFSVFSAVRVADDKLLTAMWQNAAYFEKAFLEGDVFETQRIMWRIKNEAIKRITFHPVRFEGSRWIFKEAVIGNLYDRPRAQLERSVPFISNGAELGSLAYVIDLVDVNAAVFSQNYILFITVVLFFLGLLAVSNMGAIQTLEAIEKSVNEINYITASGKSDIIRDSIKKNISRLPQGIIGTPFAQMTERMSGALEQAARLENELAVSKATSDLAAQVAHDIRSPLAALGASVKGLNVPEEQRTLIDGAVGRMQGIADDLLRRYRAPGAEIKGKVETCALSGLIEQVVAEKRIQHKERAGLKIAFDNSADGARAAVDPKELQRLISNLVNNAVEALEKGGSVAVVLSASDGRVLIKISDDGKGIPSEILLKLGQKGETHGKSDGTGLGLYHARVSVESWGGSLTIESEPGKGTSVLISLPAAAKPAAGLSAVLLDDDPLVHMNWRMAAKAAGAELKAYKTPQELLAAAETLPRDIPLYIDSELADGAKGEDIAAELHDKGFTDITMATGHRADKFARLPWLKVSGKEPPWYRPV
ncbi:MAG TPA: HAMP domain-containing sensor histidine kinase [Elusimicrobiales bacterium]|nr:HAMP domain-containing sensor histidine kinase [Elusimicrobiales bacterium]